MIFLTDTRLEICRDRHNRQSCKFFFQLCKFFQKTTHFSAKFAQKYEIHLTIWKVYTHPYSKTIEILHFYDNFNQKGTKFVYIESYAALSLAKAVAIYEFFGV